tara:strand:- start:572 stop:784 length:213 start_codon:yes stop_codon:yes gene_type:complete
MNNSVFQRGDLVRWYELYDDDIIKDGGIGVVIGEFGTNSRYGLLYYRVLKQETGEVASFHEDNLEILTLE